MGSPSAESLCPGRSRGIKNYLNEEEKEESLEDDGY